MNILLTGGAGYIGSHTAVALTEAGHKVVILDNFSNSSKNVLDRLRQILNRELAWIEADVRDTPFLIKTLKEFEIDAVIHFAGLKAVGESVEMPIDYYANNVQGTISLLEAMNVTDIKNLVFSSSATVYGDPQYFPIDESHPTSTTNAYGRSKLHIEEMLKDVSNSDPTWRIICLRYFNPIGAHESGLIGEDPNGIPNNLVPYISQVAIGKLSKLNVYGADYPTIDGTGVRDYIHVMDLAEGHIAALTHIFSVEGWDVINLGTGNGVSVFEILQEYEKSSGKIIPYSIENRRPGDIATCFARVDKAEKILGWKARRSVQDMCRSGWLWQQYRKTWD